MKHPAPSPADITHGSIARIEAFSDGVIAIIVTIMVLDLHAPEVPGLAALAHLWPTFLAYVLSYLYVAIYWVNHHRLLSHARVVTNRLVWSNMALLFTLSLVPFTTAYLGAQHFSAEALRVYLAALLLPAVAYVSLQRTIARSGSQGPGADAYHRATIRKGVAAALFYAAGMALAGVSAWFGVGAAVLVALAWCLPESGVDRWFGGCEEEG